MKANLEMIDNFFRKIMTLLELLLACFYSSLPKNINLVAIYLDFRVTSKTELNKVKQKLHWNWFQSCVLMQKILLQMNKSRGKARKDRV